MVSLGGIGVIFGALLGGVAGLFGFIFTGFFVLYRKLRRKVRSVERF